MRYLFLFLLTLGLDQVSKLWILAKQVTLPMRINEYFNLVFTLNKGVSFSLFASDKPGHSLLLSLFSALILISVFIFFLKENSKAGKISLIFILAGGIGNIIDRLRIGSVVDFLDFHLGSLHWPAFNFADSFIVLGVGLFLLHVFLKERAENK